jgi:hypothetical protein
MKIRVLFIITGLFLLSVSMNAQDSTLYYRPRSVYIEFGGNAVFYSINFENQFTHFKYHNIGLRIGCTYYMDMIRPLATLNYYFGRRNHFLEIGSGIMYGDAYDYDVVWTETIGYRYIIEKNGLFFRADFTLSFLPEDIDSDRIWKWGGISIGYAFKSKKHVKCIMK